MYVYMHSFLESWVVVSLVFSSVSCSVWTILPIYLTQSGSSQFLPNTCLHGITKEFHFIYYLFVLFLSCARSSLLCGPFSSCGQWGLLSSCIVWPLIAVASPVPRWSPELNYSQPPHCRTPPDPASATESWAKLRVGTPTERVPGPATVHILALM